MDGQMDVNPEKRIDSKLSPIFMITVVHVIAVMHVIADLLKNLRTIISRRYLDGAATNSKNDFEKRVEQNSLTIEFLLHPDIIWEKSEIRRRW
jgi:hypothetical protein